MKKVYFDNAATTILRKEVIYTMTNVLKTEYGNPSSTHSYGRSSKSLIETCRKDIANWLKVDAAEIIFTSGGTEADNLILQSAVCDLKVERIISSRIEHHAVLHTLEKLQSTYGISVIFVEINSQGEIDLDHLEALLKESNVKTLVSLMHINNEIGAILPLEKVATLCKQHNALFHSDTVQSVGHFPLDFSTIPIDFAVASAHKFHGPKGVGFAFIRKSSRLQPLIIGGAQERGLRAGTEAVYAIAGMTEALKWAYQNLEKEREYIIGLKNYFIDQLTQKIPSVIFNGASRDPEKTTYNILNFQLPLSPQKALMLLFQLDLKGIACSQGSACQSGSNQGSHVIAALNPTSNTDYPSLRFSFSVFNTKDEIDYAIETLQELVQS